MGFVRIVARIFLGFDYDFSEDVTSNVLRSYKACIANSLRIYYELIRTLEEGDYENIEAYHDPTRSALGS